MNTIADKINCLGYQIKTESIHNPAVGLCALIEISEDLDSDGIGLIVSLYKLLPALLPDVDCP